MTSLAFIMGVVPLVTSTGAGSEMRHAMGIAVFSGMLGVTFFGLFLTPVFYTVIRRLRGDRPMRAPGHRELPTGDIIVINPEPIEPLPPALAFPDRR